MPPNNPSPNDPPPSVVAVVAAYRPDPSLTDSVQALQQQVAHVVVVDDGSPDGSEAVLAGLADAGALVVRQPQNSGIAAALNAGIAAARTRWNPDFFLTLDQDSRPVGEYVRRGAR